MSQSRTHQRWFRVGAVLSLTLLGCTPPSAVARGPRPTSNLTDISRAEIDTDVGRYGTAYDIVRTLRPGMLVTRGPTRAVQTPATVWQANPTIKVYLDGVQFGGVESLAMIPARDVLDVRWLSAVDATTRYGTGNAAGVIVVTTRSGRQ